MRVWMYEGREGSLRFYTSDAKARAAKSAEDVQPISVFDTPTKKVRSQNFKTPKDLVNFLNHYAA
jgi:hypothetical protein